MGTILGAGAFLAAVGFGLLLREQWKEQWKMASIRARGKWQITPNWALWALILLGLGLMLWERC